MPFDESLFYEMQVQKHLLGMHDQDTHADKGKKKSGGGKEKGKGIARDGDLSGTELLFLSGAALAAGMLVKGSFPKKSYKPQSLKSDQDLYDLLTGNKPTKSVKTSSGIKPSLDLSSIPDGVDPHVAVADLMNNKGFTGHGSSFANIKVLKEVDPELGGAVDKWIGSSGPASKGFAYGTASAGEYKLMEVAQKADIPEGINEVHRGMKMSEADPVKLFGGDTVALGDVKVGDELPLIPSSHSVNAFAAKKFSGEEVTFTIRRGEDGLKGFNIDPVSTFGHEDEIISGGMLRVVEVNKDVKVRSAVKGTEGTDVYTAKTQIVFEQVGTLDPAKHAPAPPSKKMDFEEAWELVGGEGKPVQSASGKWSMPDTVEVVAPKEVKDGEVPSLLDMIHEKGVRGHGATTALETGDMDMGTVESYKDAGLTDDEYYSLLAEPSPNYAHATTGDMKSWWGSLTDKAKSAYIDVYDYGIDPETGQVDWSVGGPTLEEPPMMSLEELQAALEEVT